MRRSPLALAIALSFVSTAHAQSAPRVADTSPSIPVTYVGPNTRISLGVDDDVNVIGEILTVFGKKDASAWLFEGWLGHGGEGGVKLDYHWVLGQRGRDGAPPANATVAKVFGAVDQNAWDDRKATLGIGFEKNDVFVDTYVSGALTDERLVGTDIDTTVRTITGVDNGRPFEQTETTVVTTRSFEHPYDWGVGVRAGRHFDQQLVRLRGGLDYEDGDYDSSQFTVSLGVDKYFRNSGHSLTLELEHYERDGDFEIDDSDTRAWLFWRYDFGTTFRPAAVFRDVERPREVTVEVPGEPVVVKNEVRMDAESFFEFDTSTLRPEAVAQLEAVIDTIKSERRVSRVNVVGSTCDIGPTAYNQSLSERRAAAVREFFESRGVETAELDVSGVGELQPKYPNDSEENRRKNRRVDVSFLTVEERTEPGTPKTETKTEMEWVREPVDAPPAFIERALRNPSEHKRTVDVYRFEEADTETTLGPRTFLNRPPVAQNDAATSPTCTFTGLPVLSNDSDPDGDTLRITAVTNGARGTATINADGTVSYTIADGTPGQFCQTGGTETFTYTIADPTGATASATVTLTVTPPPLDAIDDTATTPEATPVVINVLANDVTLPGSVIGTISTPANGTATASGSGSIRYVPRNGFVGTDTFTYQLVGPGGRVDTATVTVTVTQLPAGTNRPPVAVDDSINTLGDLRNRIDVRANDSDPDGDPFVVVSVTPAANGTVEIDRNNYVVYRANAGFCGVDTFTYTIRDPGGLTSTATVTVNVLD